MSLGLFCRMWQDVCVLWLNYFSLLSDLIKIEKYNCYAIATFSEVSYLGKTNFHCYTFEIPPIWKTRFQFDVGCWLKQYIQKTLRSHFRSAQCSTVQLNSVILVVAFIETKRKVSKVRENPITVIDTLHFGKCVSARFVAVRDRLQIVLLYLSEFKRIN